jgi:putative transposase
MTATLPLPFAPFVLQHLRSFSNRVEATVRRLLRPHPDSLPRGILADLLRSKADLIAENALLRQQLILWQRQVKRPHLNRRDRFWLLLWASRVANWKQSLRIIQPDTLLRWQRQGFRLFWKRKSTSAHAQPKLPPETIRLIQQMARENLLWGAGRIQGELLKLGLPVAKRTVQKYMRRARPPHPAGQTWATFLKTHAQDLWACDFLPVVDLWFRQTFIFFIIELSSRRVVHFGVTRTPTEVWVTQQLREATPYGASPKYLIRDNDQKFGTRFDRVAKETGIEVLRIPYRAPQANAICERFLGSVRRECLDHILILSERQLYRVIRGYVAYFNQARPHQGLEQRIPEGPREVMRARRPGKIIALPVLSGLHHDNRRAA